MKRIEQGRQSYEIDASTSPTLKAQGYVRMTSFVGHNGQMHNLSPETARELGRALIAQADENEGKGLNTVYRVEPRAADVEKFRVGSRVVWKYSAQAKPMTIAEIITDRDDSGRITYRFRAVDADNAIDPRSWRSLDNYRLATPEDEARAKR